MPPQPTRGSGRGPRLVHVTTTDISLALLLGPQLRAFAAAGYEVIGASAPGPYVAQLEADGITHVPLRYATRGWAPHHDVLALVELARLFRRLRPSIVHTHNPKPGVYGRVAAKLAGVPGIVNTVHGLYAQRDDPAGRRLPVYALERVAAACSDYELVQNPEDLDTLAALGVPRRKLHLLGNGVDLGRFDPDRVVPDAGLRASLGAGPDDIVCLAAGRLVREKGFAELFDAARRLRSSAPQVKVVVAGARDPAKHDALEVDADVAYLGMRADIEAVYAAADLVVLPSHREGFPRVPMEAAAMGLPVVATDIRGCRETVDHGVTGVLVPPRDPAALAEAVAGLAADPRRRAAFGAAARQKALAEFDDRAVIARTLAAYDALLRPGTDGDRE